LDKDAAFPKIQKDYIETGEFSFCPTRNTKLNGVLALQDQQSSGGFGASEAPKPRSLPPGARKCQPHAGQTVKVISVHTPTVEGEDCMPPSSKKPVGLSAQFQTAHFAYICIRLC
jgi:hypothetical protein